EVAGAEPDQRAEGDAHGHRAERHGDRYPAPPDDAREDVPSQVVGAEQVLPALSLQPREDVLVLVVVRRQPRRQQRHHDAAGDDQDREQAERVAGQPPHDGYDARPPARLGGRYLQGGADRRARGHANDPYARRTRGSTTPYNTSMMKFTPITVKPV